LTVPMVARLQGFPDGYQFEGSKTHAYRQVGNAFPAPVAKAVAHQIKRALAAVRHTSPVLRLPVAHEKSSPHMLPPIVNTRPGTGQSQSWTGW
jgi:hypothetical protein